MRLCAFLSSLFLVFSASADYGPDPETASKRPAPYVEAKAGYFFFASPTMREVYDNGGIDVQLSGAYPLTHHLRVYGSAEYFQKSGHSLNGNQATSFWAVPFSLGLQPVFRISKRHPIFFYWTIGPRYFLTWVHNDSEYISKHMKANNIGGFANLGLMLQIYRGLRFDAFAEGSYARLHYSSKVAYTQGNTVQVGGYTFGGGLAYAF